jgi:hypothetical protein
LFFPSSVTRYPYSSKDAHHAVSYGTAATLTCKYAKISKKIEDANGNEILSVAWTSFPPGTSVNMDDKIVLPDGTYPKIVKIHAVHDHMGNNVCTDVYYGDAGGEDL